jgi:hypothetical protein
MARQIFTPVFGDFVTLADEVTKYWGQIYLTIIVLVYYSNKRNRLQSEHSMFL